MSNKVVQEHQKGQRPHWPIGKPALPPGKNAPMGAASHVQVGSKGSAAHEAGESSDYEAAERKALKGRAENEAIEESGAKAAFGGKKAPHFGAGSRQKAQHRAFSGMK